MFKSVIALSSILLATASMADTPTFFGNKNNQISNNAQNMYQDDQAVMSPNEFDARVNQLSQQNQNSRQQTYEQVLNTLPAPKVGDATQSTSPSGGGTASPTIAATPSATDASTSSTAPPAQAPRPYTGFGGHDNTMPSGTENHPAARGGNWNIRY